MSCSHTLACIYIRSYFNPLNHVDEYYSKEAYERAYALFVLRMNNQKTWLNPRSNALVFIEVNSQINY